VTAPVDLGKVANYTLLGKAYQRLAAGGGN
jgi:hypothetical protein